MIHVTNLATIYILVTDSRITVALVVLPELTLLEETEIQFDTSGQEFMMLNMTFWEDSLAHGVSNLNNVRNNLQNRSSPWVGDCDTGFLTELTISFP